MAYAPDEPLPAGFFDGQETDGETEPTDKELSDEEHAALYEAEVVSGSLALTPAPQESTALESIDDLSRQLAVATSIVERAHVRKVAKTLTAAAVIWKYKEVAVKSAALLMDAERVIAQETPKGKGGKRADGEPNKVDLPDGLTPAEINNMRSVHTRLTDAQYGRERTSAVESGVVLTRGLLKEAGKQRQREARTAAAKEAHEEARQSAAAGEGLPPNLHVCPVADLHAHVEAGSVDYVVTDPPYGDEEIEAGVYRDLYGFAVHALKPGGLLLTMVPNGAPMVDVLQDGVRAGLEFRCLMAMTLPGGNLKLHREQITVMYRPWAAFWHGPRPADVGYSHNLIQGALYKPSYKKDHPWGQNEQGVLHVLREWIKRPGAVVCDPFAGAGSILRAAQTLGHTVIGGDIEPKCVETTAAKLEAPVDLSVLDDPIPSPFWGYDVKEDGPA